MRKCPECAREYDDTYDVCDCGHVFRLRKPVADAEGTQAGASRYRYEALPLRLFARAGSALGGGLVGKALGSLSVAGSADPTGTSEMVARYVGAGVGALAGLVLGLILSARREREARKRSEGSDANES